MSNGAQSRVYLGDCLDVPATLPAGSVDAVITAPPYGFRTPGCLAWDQMPPRRAWDLVRRVLRPSSPLAVMAPRRLYHRLASCSPRERG